MHELLKYNNNNIILQHLFYAVWGGIGSKAVGSARGAFQVCYLDTFVHQWALKVTNGAHFTLN